MTHRFGATVVVLLMLMSVSVLGSTSVAHAQGTALFRYPSTPSAVRGWMLDGGINDGVRPHGKVNQSRPIPLWLMAGAIGGLFQNSWVTELQDSVLPTPNPCVMGHLMYDSQKTGSINLFNGARALEASIKESGTDTVTILGFGCGDPKSPLPPLYSVNEEVIYQNVVTSQQRFVLNSATRLWVRLLMEQTSKNVGQAVFDGNGDTKFEVWSDINNNGRIDAPDALIFRHGVTTEVNNVVPNDFHRFPTGPYSFPKGNYVARLEFYHYFRTTLAGNLAVDFGWVDAVKEAINVQASLTP